MPSHTANDRELATREAELRAEEKASAADARAA
eukprot:CAMPEP_0203850314 /NCGR_PEP_ID=MMETSP0359-20131031/6699_1 /ASSEMBLY_ACC=CAM_ASM_000338 /TAXON_ID=268821 /ORGANISM="Scrippsiella Hangoei, Strain SHTV-5" /LENGTH=32 /DNA_ID= /DNA_START= /DNA_END= /DNA_ORIENTATION=